MASGLTVFLCGSDLLGTVMSGLQSVFLAEVVGMPEVEVEMVVGRRVV